MKYLLLSLAIGLMGCGSSFRVTRHEWHSQEEMWYHIGYRDGRYDGLVTAARDYPNPSNPWDGANREPRFESQEQMIKEMKEIFHATDDCNER